MSGCIGNDPSFAEVTRFEQALLDDIRANGSEILAAIRDEKDISDEIEEKLKDFVEGFTKAFV